MNAGPLRPGTTLQGPADAHHRNALNLIGEEIIIRDNGSYVGLGGVGMKKVK